MKRTSRFLFAALLVCLAATSVQAMFGFEVVSLNEHDFEARTQSSTGQTTGVWFVRFCAPSVEACEKTEKVWDHIAERLDEITIVAAVNTEENPGLASRFKVTELPTAILFRERSMFRYHGQWTEDSLERFAKIGFELFEPEDVPPASLDFIQGINVLFAATMNRIGIFGRLIFYSLPLAALALYLALYAKCLWPFSSSSHTLPITMPAAAPSLSRANSLTTSTATTPLLRKTYSPARLLLFGTPDKKSERADS